MTNLKLILATTALVAAFAAAPACAEVRKTSGLSINLDNCKRPTKVYTVSVDVERRDYPRSDKVYYRFPKC